MKHKSVIWIITIILITILINSFARLDAIHTLIGLISFIAGWVAGYFIKKAYIKYIKK